MQVTVAIRDGTRAIAAWPGSALGITPVETESIIFVTIKLAEDERIPDFLTLWT